LGEDSLWIPSADERIDVDVQDSVQKNGKRTNWLRKGLIAVVLIVVVVPLLVAIPAFTGNPITAEITFGILAAGVAVEVGRYYRRSKQFGVRKYFILLFVVLVGGMLAGALLSRTAGVVGSIAVLLVAAGTTPTDIGAQLFGRKWGEHRLPRPLHNKSWEGITSGIFLGWTWGGIAFVLTHLFWVSLPLGMLLIVVLTPPLAMVGDVFESLVKRYIDIPDMSRILKDHGGLAERTDSPSLPLIVALLVVVCL